MGFTVARIAGEIIIRRPVEDVFDFVADERNETRYNAHMLRVEKISDDPIGVGTRFQAELKTMGRTMPMVVEFTGFGATATASVVDALSDDGHRWRAHVRARALWHAHSLGVGRSAARPPEIDGPARRHNCPPARATHLGQPQAVVGL
jgi:hypothetical protein